VVKTLKYWVETMRQSRFEERMTEAQKCAEHARDVAKGIFFFVHYGV
jgi:hypothetical protein